jgi:2-oxoglutarate dehydrogenase E2 component (dihydrolipoamide succinyltransferase)
MKTTRKCAASLLGSIALVAASGAVASAQNLIVPSATPVQNKSGLGPLGAHVSLAVLLGLLGLVVVVALLVGYMRRAPRFARDEDNLKVVRADRVLPGMEAPRRAVDISQAAPVVVAPPAVPVAVGVGAGAVVGVGTPAAPAAPSPAPIAAAPAAAPVAASPAPAAPAEAPAAATPAPAAPAPRAERPEVSLDQETFDKTLEELLAKGTDRRVAEGQARRAAMIAARKKAAGEG